jgi:hypothetical protein
VRVVRDIVVSALGGALTLAFGCTAIIGVGSYKASEAGAGTDGSDDSDGSADGESKPDGLSESLEPTDSSADVPAGTCGNLPSWGCSACDACMNEHCCMQEQTCAADAECRAYQLCLLDACTDDNTCADQHEEGYDTAMPAYTCLMAHCLDECQCP